VSGPTDHDESEYPSCTLATSGLATPTGTAGAPSGNWRGLIHQSDGFSDIAKTHWGPSRLNMGGYAKVVSLTRQGCSTDPHSCVIKANGFFGEWLELLA
jgi:hypothetical protein